MTDCIFLKHSDGATHKFGGKRYAKLVRELKAGRGGPEVLALVEAGYETFFGPKNEPTCIDAMTAEHVS